MENVFSSSSHKVLGNAYLLFLILSFQNKHSLTQCTRVCKAWFGPAAGLIWKDVPKLDHIIRLLVDSGHTVALPTELKDCSRFDLYATRIQSLALPRVVSSNKLGWRRVPEHAIERRSPPYLMSRESFVFQKLTRIKPNLDEIFPRLHTLTVKLDEFDCFYMLSVLLQPTLRTLSMQFILDYTKSDYREVFKLMKNRCPSLEKLSLTFSANCGDLEDELLSLWKFFPNLSDISFPQSFMTPHVMLVLARLPNFRGIHAVEDEPSPPQDDAAAFAGFPPVPDSPILPLAPVLFYDLEKDEFPSLTRFSIKLDLDKAVEFFSKPISLQLLTSLQLTSRAPEDLTMLSSCLTLLAERCSALERLVIILRSPSQWGPPERKQITYDHLKSLLSFHHLVDFTLDAEDVDWLFCLTDEDVEDLTTKWSSLKHFHLKSDAFHSEDSMKLSSLTVFAKHCPKLETLTLYLDDLDDPRSLSYTPFSSLYELSVGRSRIQDPCMLAIFLSGILPHSCTINYPSRSRPQPVDPLGYPMSFEPESPWKKVIEYLRLINLVVGSRARRAMGT